MLNTRYAKFILTVAIIWLFIFAFLWFSIENRKLDAENQKLWGWGIKLLDKERFIEKPYKIVKLDNSNFPLVRFNEQTGEADYWGIQGGGWVKIVESGMRTAIPTEEIQERRKILNEWYNTLSEKLKSLWSKEAFFELYIDNPSSQIKFYFDFYKENPQDWESEVLKNLEVSKKTE